MNPVGNPLANTSSELMLEVIEGLKAAGVKTKDMFVFERYRDEFIDAGMHKAVPDGIALGRPDARGRRLAARHHRLASTGNDPVAGYDPDEFVDDGAGPPTATTRRTTATCARTWGCSITRRVNKLVMLPVLKDHGSAGVTGALKNMSHGSVNNVARSHSTPDDQRLQPVHPRGRQPPDHPQEVRPADHGRDQGGLPGGPVRRANPEWTWEYNALLLRDRPGGDGPRRVAASSTPSARRRASRRSPPPARLGLDPLEHRGVRHPPAAAHRPGGQPRPGHLRLQVAQGAAAVDRPPGRSTST